MVGCEAKNTVWFLTKYDLTLCKYNFIPKYAGYLGVKIRY